LNEMGIPNLIEVSQSGEAAHNWIFFADPTSAAVARNFWGGICQQLEITTPEIYPRQNSVDVGSLCNLIRLPLWNKSHFVDIQWAKIEPEAALTVAKINNGQLPRIERKSPPSPAAL